MIQNTKRKKLCIKAYAYHKKQTGRKKALILLLSLAGVLAAAAVIVFAMLWNEGVTAQKEAQAVLDASGIMPKISGSAEGNTVNGVTATPVSALTPELQGYTVIARLDIEKIGARLPVLAETTDAALKVSACYYEGELPGKDGNMVITGHNYANGAIFGKLDQMKAGDAVLLTSQDGTTQAYTVYEVGHIKPDEPGALNDMEYARELTLLTCESHGNGRLIVRCRIDN